MERSKAYHDGYFCGFLALETGPNPDATAEQKVHWFDGYQAGCLERIHNDLTFTRGLMEARKQITGGA